MARRQSKLFFLPTLFLLSSGTYRGKTCFRAWGRTLQEKGSFMKLANQLLSLVVPVVAAIGLLNSPAMLWSQTGGNSGEIVGQVLDSSSASISGAKVTVRNKATNFTRGATTDSAGRYAVSLLPLGPYEVTAKAAGFNLSAQEAAVGLGDSVTADFKLSVGASREAVEVKAELSAPDPTLALSKSVLTDLQIHDLPSNGRRLQNLIWDIPGGQLEPE